MFRQTDFGGFLVCCWIGHPYLHDVENNSVAISSMLSLENAWIDWTTWKKVKNSNRSNQRKKQLCTCSSLFFSTFLCRCFARLHRETSRNFLVSRFMEEMSYVFSLPNFLLPLIFILHWWSLAFRILSPPLQNFHVALPTKKMSPSFFLSRSRSLSPFFSLSFAGLQPDFLFFSVFLLPYIPNLQTCGTINLS